MLVNNAGFAALTPLGGTTSRRCGALLDIHVTGVVMLTQALVPLLADGGRIVNTSTGLARFTGDFGYSVYASAKGAVEVWTRYLAQELGPRRITVNAVAPGATGTDFGGGSLRDDEQRARPARRRDRDGPRRPPRRHRRRGRRDRVGRGWAGSPASASRPPAGCGSRRMGS